MNQTLTLLDLFSGIGGFSYAAERLVGGFRTVAFCETNGACQRVLAKHWPSTPIFPDVCTLTAQDILPLCPTGLDIITAGFPCQDLSVAGKQAGYDGERSSLFYEIIRLARELRPQFLLLENVRNLLSHQNGTTFQETLFQIAKAGYDAEWAVIPASDVGACHRRERIWIVAYASRTDRKRRPEGAGRWQRGTADVSGCEFSEGGRKSNTTASHASSGRNIRFEEHTRKSFQLECMGETRALDATHANDSRLERREPAIMPQYPPQWSTMPGNSSSAMLSPEWTAYVSKPVLRRGDDGLSNRVDRLKQLGNSIVPQVAAIPLQRIKYLCGEEE